MQVDIIYEKHWYSAYIKKLAISTQAKTWENLMDNIQEAVLLHYEEETKYQKQQVKNLKFYLNILPEHANKLL